MSLIWVGSLHGVVVNGCDGHEVVWVQGVQLDAVDGAGNTALMDAIRHSHKEVQAALRAAGANLAAVNVADKLCLAAAENDTATLEVCPSFSMLNWIHSCSPQLGFGLG